MKVYPKKMEKIKIELPKFAMEEVMTGLVIHFKSLAVKVRWAERDFKSAPPTTKKMLNYELCCKLDRLHHMNEAFTAMETAIETHEACQTLTDFKGKLNG